MLSCVAFPRSPAPPYYLLLPRTVPTLSLSPLQPFCPDVHSHVHTSEERLDGDTDHKKNVQIRSLTTTRCTADLHVLLVAHVFESSCVISPILPSLERCRFDFVSAFCRRHHHRERKWEHYSLSLSLSLPLSSLLPREITSSRSNDSHDVVVVLTGHCTGQTGVRNR